MMLVGVIRRRTVAGLFFAFVMPIRSCPAAADSGPFRCSTGHHHHPATRERNILRGASRSLASAGHPPDTNGDVGPQHYIQTINTSVGIYSKNGTRLATLTFNSLMGQGSFGIVATPNFGGVTGRSIQLAANDRGQRGALDQRRRDQGAGTLMEIGKLRIR